MRHVAVWVCVAGAACGGARGKVEEPTTGPAFPGFSLAMPKGRVAEAVMSYASGRVEVVDLDREGSSIAIRWGPGSIDPADLPVTIDTDRARGLTSSPSFTPGPNGTAIPTVVAQRADRTVERFSVVTCGTRRIYLGMTGRDIAARHASLVQSFACRSDPAREPGPGAIRIAVDLPGFFTQPDGRLAGQLNLTNAMVNIILREQPPSGEGRFEPREELTWVVGLVLGDAVGGHHHYTGKNSSGDEIEGFVIERKCTTFDVRINAYIRLGYAAHLQPLVASLDAARCLDRGEPPPTWPDAPARR